MGRASQALKKVLETYGISQNKLATVMGVGRGSVNRWFQDKRDPTAETVVEIVKGLKVINQNAAEDFIQAFILDVLSEEQE